MHHPDQNCWESSPSDTLSPGQPLRKRISSERKHQITRRTAQHESIGSVNFSNFFWVPPGSSELFSQKVSTILWPYGSLAYQVPPARFNSFFSYWSNMRLGTGVLHPERLQARQLRHPTFAWWSQLPAHEDPHHHLARLQVRILMCRNFCGPIFAFWAI